MPDRTYHPAVGVAKVRPGRIRSRLLHFEDRATTPSAVPGPRRRPADVTCSAYDAAQGPQREGGLRTMSTPIDLGPAARRMQAVVAGIGDLLDHVMGLALAFRAAAQKASSEADGPPPQPSAQNLPVDWRGGPAHHDRRFGTGEVDLRLGAQQYLGPAAPSSRALSTRHGIKAKSATGQPAPPSAAVTVNAIRTTSVHTAGAELSSWARRRLARAAKAAPRGIHHGSCRASSRWNVTPSPAP